VADVHILLATDADWIVDEVTAALGDTDTTFTVVRDGRLVAKLVAERGADLVIADLQVGSMGGVAITMALRLDESAGVLGRVPTLILLDRTADVYIAQRADADGWLIKPIDALRLRRAVDAVMAGDPYAEGVPAPIEEIDPDMAGDERTGDAGVEDSESPESEPANAG